MTDMEILQLADKCGVVAVTQHQWDGKRFNHTDDYLDGDAAALVIFAKAVAQHEREACLKIAESMSLTDANMNKTWRTGCRDVAEAIRARSSNA